VALDDLDEDRAHEVAREDLQEVAALVAVDEHVVVLDAGVVFGDARHPVEDLGVVVVLDVEKLDLVRALELVEGAEDVARREGEVLNPGALVLLQVLVDLRLLLVGLVDGDAELPAGRAQRVGREARERPADVEVAHLAEVEDRLIEVCPVLHGALVDVVGEVIDDE
jgi:hypothetical protein